MVVKAKPKIAKASEAAKKSGDTNLAITVMVGVAAVAAGGYFFFMRSKVVALSPSDSAKLKSVFYSGEPWLVECTKTKNASPMVYAAESLLKGVQIGTLDCSAPLPSGKTTFEKFKINPPSYGPVLLAAANTERPQLVPPINAFGSSSWLACPFHPQSPRGPRGRARRDGRAQRGQRHH